MVLTPSLTGKLDAHVDADFAGLWHPDYAELRESVLSRSGYILTYMNCPLLWASKIQSEVTLSTNESEYVALSTCMRGIIPMRTLITELHKNTTKILKCIDQKENKVRLAAKTRAFKSLPPTTVWEDNVSCLVLATEDDKYIPRTKNIAVKYHHFHDQVKNGTCKVQKVASALNTADIFTKPLPETSFIRHRFTLLGW